MSGKGSKQRPIKDPDKYRENWDLIFGKKKPERRKEDKPRAGAIPWYESYERREY